MTEEDGGEEDNQDQDHVKMLMDRMVGECKPKVLRLVGY